MEDKDTMSLLSELRDTFKSGKTKSLEWRKTQLQALSNMVEHQEKLCFQALFDDVGKGKLEAYKDEVFISSLLSFMFYLYLSLLRS